VAWEVKVRRLRQRLRSPEKETDEIEEVEEVEDIEETDCLRRGYGIRRRKWHFDRLSGLGRRGNGVYWRRK
jgi:hypothetical protein